MSNDFKNKSLSPSPPERAWRGTGHLSTQHPRSTPPPWPEPLIWVRVRQWGAHMVWEGGLLPTEVMHLAPSIRKAGAPTRFGPNSTICFLLGTQSEAWGLLITSGGSLTAEGRPLWPKIPTGPSMVSLGGLGACNGGEVSAAGVLPSRDRGTPWGADPTRAHPGVQTRRRQRAGAGTVFQDAPSTREHESRGGPCGSRTARTAVPPGPDPPGGRFLDGAARAWGADG